MKKSRYNVEFYKTIPNKVVIYNTLYNSLSILDMSEYEQYKDNQYTCDSLVKELLSQKILLPSPMQELRLVKKLFLKNKSISKDIVTLRILTTRCCNARCFYCYEDLAPTTMQNSDVPLLIDFLKQISGSCSKLNIGWFGGEPLINTDVIDEFYKQLDVEPNLKNKVIRSSIVTNGSLITNEIVSKMATAWKIKNVQITLDGTEIEHNKRKNYRSSINGFKTTIENIKKLLDTNKIIVHIRLNYDKNNVQSILDLIKFISTEFLEAKKLFVYAYPLFDTNDSLLNNEIKKADELIRQCLCNYGYGDNRIAKYRKCQCFATSDKGFVIDANCNVYKCVMMLDNNEHLLGNLRDSVNYENIDDWKLNDFPLKCKKCKYLPICLGGCRSKYLLNGRVFCSIDKFTLENQIKEYLKGVKT